MVSFSACSNQQGDNTSVQDSADAQPEKPVLAYYGEQIDDQGAVPASAIVEALAGKDSVNLKVEGTVEKVCQAKGCWMTMQAGNDQNVMIKFRDYGFFVPKDISGKTVVIEGTAYVDTLSVEELKHYAEDEGKSKEEIEQINEPVVKLTFVADGVIVRDYQPEPDEHSSSEG
ncbi:MAG: hypothetical protein Kow0075_07880 [Salibacteraceae bacterium]